MRSGMLTLTVALVACTAWQSDGAPGQRERTVDEPNSQATAITEPVTLGKLRTRGHEITIRSSASSSGGPTFTVLSLEDGRVRNDVDTTTFARDFPELFRDYERAFANADAPGATIDASVGRPKTAVDALRTPVIDAGL